MAENIQTALTLMAVGMITVFSILGLVVLTGKVLVNVINQRYQAEKRPVFVHRTKMTNRRKEGRVSEAQIAAIVAAIDAITAGQGKIEKIEKLT